MKLTKREKQLLVLTLKSVCGNGDYQYWETPQELKVETDGKQTNIYDQLIDKLIVMFNLDWNYRG